MFVVYFYSRRIFLTLIPLLFLSCGKNEPEIAEVEAVDSTKSLSSKPEATDNKKSVFERGDYKRRRNRKPKRESQVGKSEKKRGEATYSSFAEVPPDIILAALVKEDSASGYRFSSTGMLRVKKFVFGDVFKVLPRTYGMVKENIDSLINWIPLSSEDDQTFWVRSDKLLLRKQAFIPVGNAFHFYKNPNDKESRISYSYNQVAAQVLLILDTSVDSLENKRIKTRLIHSGEDQPGKWVTHIGSLILH